MSLIAALRTAFVAGLLLLSGSPLLAEPPAPPDIPLADPGLEAKATSLMHELRCLTCQNQSIAESNAGQAQAMRAEVRTLVAAGKTPVEVRAFFIERYGNWVSFVPPARTDTMLLWGAPVLLLLLGGFLVSSRFRK